MKLRNLLSDNYEAEPCILGIGSFDGVHIGHQKLISDLIACSKRMSLPSVVLTFDCSPRKLLSPDSFKGYITTPEEKFSLLMSSGIDSLVFRLFDEPFAKMAWQEFVKNILVNRLQANTVVIGFNFGFGKGKAGNADTLKTELAKFGCKCEVTQPVIIDGQVVSSSLIREAILNGDFERANKFLGREVCFTGKVIHGDHRGREMGFPTANLKLEESMKTLPPNGVYACYVDIDGESFEAIVNIGMRPTFSGKEYLLEAHLPDFSSDLYHKTIKVRFVQRIREEQKFADMQSLIFQIHKDITDCHTFFGS